MDRSNSFLCLKYSLTSINSIGICVGCVGFVTGLARPDFLVNSSVSGTQLAIASVIAILIAIIGLIGTLSAHYGLLLTYGCLILLSFVIRILWTVSSYWHKGESFFLDSNAASTIMTVILLLFLMIFAFLMAHATRISKLDRKWSSIQRNA